jgi:hypothetical protein
MTGSPDVYALEFRYPPILDLLGTSIYLTIDEYTPDSPTIIGSVFPQGFCLECLMISRQNVLHRVGSLVTFASFAMESCTNEPRRRHRLAN